MPDLERFELLGHDCPYGEYPAPVIPIGRLRGKLVAVCPGRAIDPTDRSIIPGPVIEYIEHVDERQVVFERHRAALKDSLRQFDWQHHRLFAYSADEVVFYRARPAEQAEFLDRFLSMESFRNCNPGIRVMIERHARSCRQAMTATA